MSAGMEAKQWSAVDGEQQNCKTATEKNQYQFKCMLYLEYNHCFTSPSDSPFQRGTQAVISALFKASRPDSDYFHILLCELRIVGAVKRLTKTLIKENKCKNILFFNCFWVYLIH